MINISQLYAAIDQKRQSEGRSWRQLAAHIGVSPSTLSRMGAGGKPDVDSFAVIIGWLGIPAERFFAVPQAESPNTLALVLAALRADPRLSDQNAEALERIVLAAYHVLSIPERSERPDCSLFTRATQSRECNGDGHHLCRQCGRWGGQS